MKDKTKREKRGEIIRQELQKLFPHPKIALDYNTPWELLVAVILSAQCTDKRVNIVTKDLFNKYPTILEYVNADVEEFQEDIRSTGFYRNKTKNILATAKMIHKVFDNNVPRTMSELLTLPGVARKTANVVLSNAFGIVEGIAVDTHVIRLSQKFKLTSEKNPEKIERDLMEVLPKKSWHPFNLRLVQYGRTYSPAKKKNDFDDPISVALLKEDLL